MLDPKKLEDFAKQIHNTLPSGVKALGEETDKKIRQLLQHQLSKLDLVTRDEFEIQTKVLLRTREKITALESRLTQLEAQLAQTEQRPAE